MREKCPKICLLSSDFMLVLEGTFGGKFYDYTELIDIIQLGVCLAFGDNGIGKENAQQRTEIFMQRLSHYTTSTIGTSEDSVFYKGNINIPGIAS